MCFTYGKRLKRQPPKLIGNERGMVIKMIYSKQIKIFINETNNEKKVIIIFWLIKVYT